jgi:hypothetical protein
MNEEKYVLVIPASIINILTDNHFIFRENQSNEKGGLSWYVTFCHFFVNVHLFTKVLFMYIFFLLWTLCLWPVCNTFTIFLIIGTRIGP